MGNCFSWFPFFGSSANSGSTLPPEGDARLPKGVDKVNDSVYKLYSPPENEMFELDVIFFHGLQTTDYADAYWKTWSSDGTIWPQDFFREKLPQARISSVRYDACANKYVSKRGGRGDFYLIGENLVSDIILDDGMGFDQERPVILVGHSLGGLLIKEFVMRAHHMRYGPGTSEGNIHKIDNFLNNLRGIFYYATPHHGARLAGVFTRVPGNSPVLNLLEVLSTDTTRLNENFRKWRAEHRTPAYSLGEGLPTKFWGHLIVEEASARADTDEYYTVQEADHISICKPRTMAESSFTKLLQFVTKCTGQSDRYNINEAEAIIA